MQPYQNYDNENLQNLKHLIWGNTAKTNNTVLLQQTWIECTWLHTNINMQSSRCIEMEKLTAFFLITGIKAINNTITLLRWMVAHVSRFTSQPFWFTTWKNKWNDEDSGLYERSMLNRFVIVFVKHLPQKKTLVIFFLTIVEFISWYFTKLN